MFLDRPERVLGNEVLVKGELAELVERCQIAFGVRISGDFRKIGDEVRVRKNVDRGKGGGGVFTLGEVEKFVGVGQVVTDGARLIASGLKPGFKRLVERGGSYFHSQAKVAAMIKKGTNRSRVVDKLLALKLDFLYMFR